MSERNNDTWSDGSSSEDLSRESWTFIRDRPEFKDVKPTPQFEGQVVVAPIAYSEEFKDVHDYLRSFLKMGEMSERALLLTNIALSINAANYTTWKYRRDILCHLGISSSPAVMSEFNYIKKMVPDNLKTYQVWHHCQKVLEWIGKPLDILDFMEEVLKQDSKNYHAWQLRQWVLQHFKCLQDSKDIAFVDKMLNEDVRNNSAWNHRFFIIHTLNECDNTVFTAEIEYTIKKIRLATNNESAWNYLRGTLAEKKGLHNAEVEKLVESLYSSGCRSPQLLIFMADKVREDCENLELSASLEKNAKICLQLYKDLATKYDQIRSRYWMYLYQEFLTEYKSSLDLEITVETTS